MLCFCFLSTAAFTIDDDGAAWARARCRFEFHGLTSLSVCLPVELVSLFLKRGLVSDVLSLRLGLYYPSLTQDQDNKAVEQRADS